MLVDSKYQKPGNDPSNNSVLSVSKGLHIFLQTPPYFMIPLDSIGKIEAKQFSFVLGKPDYSVLRMVCKDCSSWT